MRELGEKVSWRGVSRVHTGEITGFHGKGYIVSLESGKCVVVAEESIIQDE